ncbi:MAG: hypothetical protein ACTSPD_10955 [Promethearchaeota archaeon]
MSHEQVFSIWDTGFFGYSKLNILFQRYFLEVSTITKSLSSYIMNMTSDDILLLNVAKNGTYTIEEINNITNFVNNGGKLIVLGEHNTLGFPEFQNPLLSNFGIKITGNDIIDNVNNVAGSVSWIKFNSSFFGLRNLSIMYGAALNLTGKAFAIANSSHTSNFPNQPIMAGYNNSNGGKVFCCTDTEWLWNCNSSLGGINYGNNSKLLLSVLDWFYNTNLGKEIENGLSIVPEFEVFTTPKYNNFTLNLTLNSKFNISTSVKGGTVFPKYGQNLIGKVNWQINVSKDGYIKFIFTKPSLKINISKIVYFFTSNSKKKALFIQNNYSRRITPSLDGLLKFALELKERNYSIFAANKILNYSTYNCVVIANPIEKYNLKLISEINKTKKHNSKLIFLNVPYSTLKIHDFMTDFFDTWPGVKPKDVPINNISSLFGINFYHHVLCNAKQNLDNKLYIPKILGNNFTFYNLSCYMTSIINVSVNFIKELFGYNNSWGEDRSIFGLSESMGFDNNDINNTCVLAYTDRILASGMLNYFINDYFNPKKFFNDFFFYWIESGEFNKKYKLLSNQTTFVEKNVNFNVYSNYKIRDLSGQVVPNGTLFTVKITMGEIISQDADLGVSGFQVKTYNGFLNITISSKTDNGLFEMCVYTSQSYKIILSIFLNFSYIPDVKNPKILINLPYNNTYWSVQPLLNVTAFDENLHKIWYNISNNPKRYFLQNNTAEFLNSTAWTGLSQGEFRISFYANDTEGNLNNTYILTLYKDTIAPTLIINSPLNNTKWNSPPLINVAAYDYVKLNKIWYRVGSINRSLTNSTDQFLDQAIWDSLEQGTFQICFYSNDSAGNINKSLKLTLYKDTIPPKIVINIPLNGTYWDIPLTFNLTVYDTFPVFIWYNVSGNSTRIYIQNNSISQLNPFIWNDLPQGTFKISFYANDSVGNINNTFTYIFIKDTLSPLITIIRPTENLTIGRIAPEFNLTIIEPNLYSTWYTIDNGNTNISFIGTKGTINQTLWENLWDSLNHSDEITIKFYAKDILGHIDYEEVVVIKYDPPFTDDDDNNSNDDDDDNSNQNLDNENNLTFTLIFIIGIVIIIGITGIIIFISKNKYKWERF